MTSYWAVIPSCCRWEELRELVTRLRSDDVNVVVIDTGYAPKSKIHEFSWQSPIPNADGLTVIRDVQQPKNISRWWNTGLRFVMETEGTKHGYAYPDFVVAVLNDDLVIPHNFVQRLGGYLYAEQNEPAVVCPDVYGVGLRHVMSLHDGPRMPGFAFAMKGSNMIFADESMQWWYGDNDVDWQARGRGGVLHVPGIVFQHLYPNSTTVGELADQAGRDRQTFEAKWGRAPW